VAYDLKKKVPLNLLIVRLLRGLFLTSAGVASVIFPSGSISSLGQILQATWIGFLLVSGLAYLIGNLIPWWTLTRIANTILTSGLLVYAVALWGFAGSRGMPAALLLFAFAAQQLTQLIDIVDQLQSAREEGR
jgi:hypothetical protein